MEITTEMIKELRAATNAGILDCRKALTEANGDFQKAVDWLREKGMATAPSARTEASQGVVELYSHGGGRVGVMVEVNCETDFVARSEQFRQLAHELSLQIAARHALCQSGGYSCRVLEHEAGIARARAKEEGKRITSPRRSCRDVSKSSRMKSFFRASHTFVTSQSPWKNSSFKT